jgi:hypothetical protein
VGVANSARLAIQRITSRRSTLKIDVLSLNAKQNRADHLPLVSITDSAASDFLGSKIEAGENREFFQISKLANKRACNDLSNRV